MFQFARSRFDYGYMCIQTDKPYYLPGEMVTGKIYMRGTSPFHAQRVDIRVEGKEKASFIVREADKPDANGHRKMKDVTKKIKRNIFSI